MKPLLKLIVPVETPPPGGLQLLERIAPHLCVDRGAAAAALSSGGGGGGVSPALSAASRSRRRSLPLWELWRTATLDARLDDWDLNWVGPRLWISISLWRVCEPSFGGNINASA